MIKKSEAWKMNLNLNDIEIKGGYIQAKDAAKLFSIHKNTWFLWRRRGIISEGVTLGYKCVGWPVEEVFSLFNRTKNSEFEIRPRHKKIEG